MELSNKILSDITVYMKYAKFVPELNRRETWEELVTRNKNMHIKKYPKLNVHYCTAKLKDAVQLTNRIKLRAENIAKPYDLITETGTACPSSRNI